MVSIKGFWEWKKLKQVEIDLASMAVGMNSSVDIPSDLHIVMLDYDIKDISKVKDSVMELQDFWNLSDAEIFKTKNGFHVFFWFDQIPYGRLKMIIEFARYVDPMYKYISRFYDHKTMRASGKYKEKDIEYVDVVKGKRVILSSEREIGDMKRQEHKSLRGL